MLLVITALQNFYQFQFTSLYFDKYQIQDLKVNFPNRFVVTGPLEPKPLDFKIYVKKHRAFDVMSEEILLLIHQNCRSKNFCEWYRLAKKFKYIAGLTIEVHCNYTTENPKKQKGVNRVVNQLKENDEAELTIIKIPIKFNMRTLPLPVFRKIFLGEFQKQIGNILKYTRIIRKECNLGPKESFNKKFSSSKIFDDSNLSFNFALTIAPFWTKAITKQGKRRNKLSK